MQSITFITGNKEKARNLEKYLGIDISYKDIEIPEIQSLELKEVVQAKAYSAFAKIGTPILVEDTSLEFTEFGKLPGTFIKFFINEIGAKKLTQLPNLSRKAIAKTMFCIYNGVDFIFFESSLVGTIAESPRGLNGFGWDTIFIPHWSDKTSAEMDAIEYERFYLEVKPVMQVRKFLQSLL